MPTEEMITVPGNLMEKNLSAIDEDTLSELEVRNRITLLADALNERATRTL